MKIIALLFFSVLLNISCKHEDKNIIESIRKFDTDKKKLEHSIDDKIKCVDSLLDKNSILIENLAKNSIILDEFIRNNDSCEIIISKYKK